MHADRDFDADHELPTHEDAFDPRAWSLDAYLRTKIAHNYAAA